MTRISDLYGSVNLSQGFPDFAAPAEVKAAAMAAIRDDVNQYAVTWGARPLREAVAREFTRRYGVDVVADEQVTVCCGSTEAMMSTMMALIDPGDEVIVFEPFYENYGPDAILSGATPRYVTLHEPDPSGRPSDRPRADWWFDPDELAAAFNNRTRAIIINTPNNPTGKVFSRTELASIAALCHKWDVVAIADEIYEHIVYDGHRHVPIATIDGMADRTVTINGLSKTYSVTGWRVGWTISPRPLTGAIRKVHDFLTVGAPAPLQEAGAVALGLADQYLPGSRGQVQAAAGQAAGHPRAAPLHVLPALRRVLHHDRHQRVRPGRRRGVRPVPGKGRRRGGSSREQLLQEFRERPQQAAVLLLQAGRDARSGRPAARQAGRRRRRSVLTGPRTAEPPPRVARKRGRAARGQYRATMPNHTPRTVNDPLSVFRTYPTSNAR